MNYDELKDSIEQYGCHAELGPPGQGWGIEQNPHELATFLTAVGPIETFLEIGTGYKAGLSRFLLEHLQVRVTTVDIQNYGHHIQGVTYVVLEQGQAHWETDQRFDVVLLDGPKEYDPLKAAYEHYKDYGKIVAFHDTVGLRACQGMRRLWDELSHYKNGRRRRRFHEAIADGHQAAGLGWEIRP